MMARIKDTEPVVEIVESPAMDYIVAKGEFNTTKGKVKTGDIVDVADLICSVSDLIKLGLA